ncbi:MAG: metallophosphoesterase family protein [Firmicutes bacterium]|nr:metallophosphoesterase family protein [Bacillota bacterium]
MKIGIITDIHSNIDALNAVLNEFEKEKVDKIICCGDIVGMSLYPEECVQTLKKLHDKLICVLGNHEKYITDGLPLVVHDDKRSLSEDEINNHNWNHKKLSDDSIKYIKNLKLTDTLDINGKKVFIVHYPMNEDKSYKRIIKEPIAEEIEELFSYVDADIYLFGHTHKYSVNKKDDKWYINPGSLGCPKNTNAALCGILEINNDEIKYKELEIKYDIDNCIKEIEESTMPFKEHIISIFYKAKEYMEVS